MAGYLKPVITLPFPDLAGVDEQGRALCWVTIRNPRLMPGDDIAGSAAVEVGPDGKPVDSGAAARESFKIMAALIVRGRVWDAKWLPELDDSGDPVDPDAEPPLLQMPPSPADVARMPMQILNRIGEEMSKVNPH